MLDDNILMLLDNFHHLQWLSIVIVTTIDVGQSDHYDPLLSNTFSMKTIKITCRFTLIVI